MIRKHRVSQKIVYSHFQSYSEDKFHYVVNVNGSILTREKEHGNKYYSETVVMVCSEHWIKVKWDWGGFSPGSISIVHVNWIQRDYARKRADPNYSKDNIVINMESVGAPGVNTRIVQPNSI